MKVLTAKQLGILKVLHKRPHGLSPTQIGEACGKDYATASSWAASALKSLVAQELVSRRQGDGRVLYAITDKGRSKLLGSTASS